MHWVTTVKPSSYNHISASIHGFTTAEMQEDLVHLDNLFDYDLGNAPPPNLNYSFQVIIEMIIDDCYFA